MTQQACEKGCLKCDSKDRCKLCNQIQNYYYDSKKGCIKTEEKFSSNCAMIDYKGKCVSCLDNNYISQGVCTPIPEEKLVANCESYDYNKNCELCQKTFRLENKKCLKIENLIVNCQVQNSETKCTSCIDSFYLVDSQEECLKIQTIQNCLLYNQFKCLKCESDYVLNYNMYTASLFNLGSSSTNQKMINFIELTEKKVIRVSNEKVCQKIQITNCKEFIDYKHCLTCEVDYYKTVNQTCTPFPEPQLENCEHYQNLTTCRQCNKGYLLVDKKCQLVEEAKVVTNCERYGGTVLKVLCLKCFEKYYLSTSTNTCILRGLTVTKCKTYSETADGVCTECDEGLIKGFGGVSCGPIIDNCSTYSVISTDSSTCSKCKELYYLDQSIIPNVCKLGSVSNCLYYQTKKNICLVCNEKYFLNSQSLCVEHKDIGNCLNYHKTQRNYCIKCESNYQSFLVESRCKENTEIPNCEDYTSNILTSQCSKCKEGFLLQNNSGVTNCILNTLPNCLIQTNGSTCTKCVENYSFNKNQVANPECVQNLSYSLQNCLQIEDEAQKRNVNQVWCQACSANAFPLDTKDTFVCIKETKINHLYSAAKTVVINCEKYSDTFNCLQCKYGFYLKAGSCVSTCLVGSDTNTQRYIAYQKFTNNKWEIRYCDTNVVAGTTTDLIMGYNMYSGRTKDYVLVKCQADITVVSTSNLATDNQYSNVDPDEDEHFVTNPHNIFPEVTCPLFIANTTSLNGNTLTTDQQFRYFQYVYQTSANTFKGLKCKKGKTGDKGVDDLQNCTIDIAECNSSVEYKNLPGYWSKFFSCHECGGDKVPVVAYQATNKNTMDFSSFVKFRLDQDDWFTGVTTSNGSNPQFCMTNSQAGIKSKLSLSVADSQIKEVANCGGYFLNLQYNGSDFNNTDAINGSFDYAGYSGNQIALMCAYCKPGYTATFVPGEDRRGVLACTAIADCDLTKPQTWLNKCESCKDNYYFGITANAIDEQKCEMITNSSTVSNCLAIKTDLCVACKKGYTLNKDSNCVKQQFSQCQAEYYGFEHGKLNPTDNLNWFLHYYEQGIGCQRCQTGFIGIYNNGLVGGSNIELQNYICISDNSLLADKTSLDKLSDGNDSNYIPNCKYYKNTSQIHCYQCQDNYLLKADFTGCLLGSGFQNCLEIDAQVVPVCQKCKQGYSLVYSESNSTVSCLEGTIQFCESYYKDFQRDKVTCKECTKQYSLVDNVCVKGRVENCDKYQNNNLFICKTCTNGYWLIKNDKIPVNEFPDNDELIIDRNYCISQHDYLNCNSPTFSLFGGNDKILKGTGSLNCSQQECNQNYYFAHQVTFPTELADNDIFSICLQYEQISNCKTYYDYQLLEKSNFSCLECETGYYRANHGSQCLDRNNKSSYAKKYEISLDEIKSCQDGYYLNDTKTDCLLYPNGIYGCKTYQIPSVCLSCDSNHYLQNNKCLKITEKVDNCDIYVNDKSCSVCQAGYFLFPLEIINEKGQDFLCYQKLENCVNQTKMGVCDKCSNRFFYNLDTKKCEGIDISNCFMFKDMDQKCAICNKNYFLKEDGTCEAVVAENIISNCDFMENDTLCKQCEKGFFLSKEKLKCLESNFDSNCTIQQSVVAAQCSVCLPGFVFDQEGKCVEVKVQLSFSSGCFAVVPGETDCLVCRNGYHMDKDFKCISDIKPTIQPEQEESYRMMKTLIVVFIINMT